VVVVLVVAAGAAWESTALSLLTERQGIVVLKRCVDLDDLLASASAGQADVAVLGADTHGLDQAAVDLLRRHSVRPVAIVPDGAGLDAARLRATRIGIRSTVSDADLGALPDAVLAEPAPTDFPPSGTALPGDGTDEPVPVAEPGGRILAVWGPAGAPGRTTLATAVAAELARRRRRTTLVDADPYGGAVAQQLGILDEVSGLLAAARLMAGGTLPERFGSVQRMIGPDFGVVTGLPRADRWVEVRSGVVEHLLEVGRDHGQVVVDTGFSLEHDPASDFGSRPARNQMTLGAIEVADEVLVVGNADPVGLSRLARGLVELRAVTAGAPVRVVVNRMRSTIGWSEKDIAGMVEGFTRLTGLHFLPDDRPGVDRALVAGRTVVESGDSVLGRAIADLVDGLAPDSAVVGPRKRLRRRTAGRARPR
jgi:MinD-like ATPase involved in chromosome partitioning or flagellar assembly